MTEHPVEKHTDQIDRLRIDVDNHECRLVGLEKVSSAREEQVKNLFQSVGRIEIMLSDIRKQVEAMISKTETELLQAIRDLSGRVSRLESRDGDKMRQYTGYAASGLIVGLIGFLLRGILQ